MAIKYYKLFDYMNRKGIKKKDLLKSEVNPDGITKPTIAKLTKNEIVTTETIDKLCTMLNCQPGDIMEFERKSNKIVNPDGSISFIIEQPLRKESETKTFVLEEKPKKEPETKTFTIEERPREKQEPTKYKVVIEDMGHPIQNVKYSFKKEKHD